MLASKVSGICSTKEKPGANGTIPKSECAENPTNVGAEPNNSALRALLEGCAGKLIHCKFLFVCAIPLPLYLTFTLFLVRCVCLAFPPISLAKKSGNFIKICVSANMTKLCEMKTIATNVSQRTTVQGCRSKRIANN